MLINAKDLRIIIKGAIHMAQQDKKVVPEEKALIQKIIQAGKIDAEEFSLIDTPLEEDISDLCLQLSSDQAKKAFLLTMFTIAYADKDFDKSEQELLDDLSIKLGVGKVKMDAHTVKACEDEGMKLISAI